LSSLDRINMLKRLIKEAKSIENWQQEIYTMLHNINGSWITSGDIAWARISANFPRTIAELLSDHNLENHPLSILPRMDLAHMPLGASGYFLKGQGTSDPVYALLTAADIPSLDASKITSGRFPMARMPDGLAGRYLRAGGSGVDPAYAVPSFGEISGTITDAQHGSRGSGLHADSHARLHALDSASDHSGTITDAQHGDKTGIPFAHHGDWAHYGKIPRTAPTGAADRAYVDGDNLWVHDGTAWVLQATKNWDNLINKPSTFPPSAHASSHEYGGADLVRNLDYLAIGGTTVIDTYRRLVGLASVYQHLNPTSTGAYDLGSSTYRWRHAYFAGRAFFWNATGARQYDVFSDNGAFSIRDDTAGIIRHAILYGPTTGSEQFRWYNTPGAVKMYLNYEGDLVIDGTYNTYSPEFPSEWTDKDYAKFVRMQVSKPHPKRSEKGEKICICGKEGVCAEHLAEFNERYARDIGALATASGKLVLNLLDRIEKLEREVETLKAKVD